MDKNIQEIIRILKEGYDKWFLEEEDRHHKSTEGSVEVIYYYGNYFDLGYERAMPVSVTVNIYSYVFGPHRRHSFEGKTLEEASMKALIEVEKWIEGHGF